MSHSGYSFYEMKLYLDKNSNTIPEILLKPEVKQLEEVVVTDQYESRRKKKNR